MSYVEKSFYWYLKRMLTSGFKLLFSRKYLPYSLFFIIIISATSILAYLRSQNVQQALELYDFILKLELAVGTGFILTGIFLGKRSSVTQFSFIIIISILAFLGYSNVDPIVLDLLAASSYIIWIAISVFASYSMFRDLFGSKVLGTILFLGKKEGEGSILFAGPIALLLLGDLGIIWYAVQNSQELTKGTIYALLAFVAAIFVGEIIILFFGSVDDVFFTSLLFFLAMGTIRLLQLVLDILLPRTKSSISWTDTILVIFFLLYSVQGMTKKAEKIPDEEIIAEGSWIGQKITMIIGDRGAVIILLGLIFGFHVTQLQVLFGESIILTRYFAGSNVSVAQLGHEIGVLIQGIWFFVLLFLWMFSPSFRKYASPEIKRFGWLPPFEDLVEFIEASKGGEIDWKKELTKFALSAAGSKIISPFKSNQPTFEERTKNFFSKMKQKRKEKKKQQKHPSKDEE